MLSNEEPSIESLWKSLEDSQTAVISKIIHLAQLQVLFKLT